MSAPEERARILKLGGVDPPSRRINLRDLGFVYRISDEALERIAANERRARRVLETAHLFWFGGGQ